MLGQRSAKAAIKRAVLAVQGKFRTTRIGRQAPHLAEALAKGRAGGNFFGMCEGIDGADLHGWAWRSDLPDQALQVEQWVDGVLKAGAPVDRARPDLAGLRPGEPLHGWRMPLIVDPNARDWQRLEVRISGGPLLPGGLIQVPDLSVMTGGVRGSCDGIRDNTIFGWAWRPRFPEERLEIQQWVDGTLCATTRAEIWREDLVKANVGDGSYGWSMPLAFDRFSSETQTIEIRAGDGVVLSGGVVHWPGQTGLDAVDSRCDGVTGNVISGWAWRPKMPDNRVEVEQWVDGELCATTRADLWRSDLQRANVGDGAHAWRMELALDPDKRGPQKVEIFAYERRNIPGGEILLERAPTPSKPETATGRVAAYCDRLEAGELSGWAWRPNFPEEQVTVEQWVDGGLVAEVLADGARSDLASKKVGHGYYGWRMPLKLDAAKTEPQIVEVRAKGGGLAENGRFELVYDPALFERREDEAVEAGASSGGVYGCVDGLKGSTLHGWAWNPNALDEQVEVELWIDGVHKSDAVANGFRPDLRANGIGHGRYGWRLPLSIDPHAASHRVEVRAKQTGEPLTNGDFELKNDYSLDDPANAELKSFVAAALKLERDTSARLTSPPPKKPTFIIYCPQQRERGAYWAREYDDYQGAAAAFAPMLRGMGDVVVLNTPDRIDALHDRCVRRGEVCVLLSFASPRLTPLDLRCPVVPVFAWAFPNLPTGTYDGDPRSDWRYVLRRTGRAITLSTFAAEAVRGAMGPDYPVMAIPAPVFERVPGAPLAAQGARELGIDGVVFDSRELVFNPNDPNVPSPRWPGDNIAQKVNLNGVVFASVLDLDDGRKNWKDLVSAFAIGHAGRRDATLVLKLAEASPTWWQELYKWLVIMPKFKCRVVGLRGDWSDTEWRSFVRAADWYVSGAKAEGLCLPLQTFLSAGRPAVAPGHTAFADYVNASNALMFDSDEEPWSWPDKEIPEGWSFTQHPRDVGPTVRHRPSWQGLVKGLERAHQISTEDRAAYSRLSEGAVRTMRELCSDSVIAAQLGAFLGLEHGFGHTAPVPAKLMTPELAK